MERDSERKNKRCLELVDCYQHESSTKHRIEKKVKETTIELPHFYGKDDVNAFLNWEMKAE